jgi:hypothetical protein
VSVVYEQSSCQVSVDRGPFQKTYKTGGTVIISFFSFRRASRSCYKRSRTEDPLGMCLLQLLAKGRDADRESCRQSYFFAPLLVVSFPYGFGFSFMYPIFGLGFSSSSNNCLIAWNTMRKFSSYRFSICSILRFSSSCVANILRSCVKVLTLDIDLDGPAAIEHAGEHGNALLGESHGVVPQTHFVTLGGHKL